MPTALPRIQVTVTDSLARALKIATGRWPNASRSELVARLAIEGAAGIETSRQERSLSRSRLIAAYRGELDGAYPAGYLDELREDWVA